MYDPRYPPYTPPCSELNDPQFWAGIAAQTGIPLRHAPPVMEHGLGQQTPRFLPVPSGPSQFSPRPTQSSPGQSSPLPVVLLSLVVIGVLVILFSTLAKPAPLHKTLTRISQLDASQYASKADADLWGPSTCSATSMTEVVNYYSDKIYRIADILSLERAQGEITPELGMLHGATSISRTVAHFGMKATAIASPTLATVTSIANSGTPVIVAFPPETWPGGHILVVVGGVTIHGTAYVHLADSSRLNMQYMKTGTFLSYWRGFAVVVEPV